MLSGTLRFAGGHPSGDAEAARSPWLQGDLRETWSAPFCRFFDGVSGKRHLSQRCFLRSAVFSIAAVHALYLLQDRVPGVLDFRAGGRIAPWQAVAIGAARSRSRKASGARWRPSGETRTALHSGGMVAVALVS